MIALVPARIAEKYDELSWELRPATKCGLTESMRRNLGVDPGGLAGEFVAARAALTSPFDDALPVEALAAFFVPHAATATTTASATTMAGATVLDLEQCKTFIDRQLVMSR